ncbi:hypothetical protein SAMD00019534_077190 [Acytostelium subglobosum LB1]|uniref:hypothetical protein n=1 Tax=Acytostelium subglobosum LB1 TaxID=1410327 RepID=UPI000644E9CB|nr:hypothetical protein SAMD00019534_077190 [Acytostelium subglobosum LB1]GAM24544.1 hypothetical protein SAMD00019534_077190 [Acytostelium subglobosum LB1]|eukprot:XP_012752213.1 hypothetical protein SAMD00019534_077190 [Acytostelium subglobosum LB1]
MTDVSSGIRTILYFNPIRFIAGYDSINNIVYAPVRLELLAHQISLSRTLEGRLSGRYVTFGNLMTGLAYGAYDQYSQTYYMVINSDYEMPGFTLAKYSIVHNNFTMHNLTFDFPLPSVKEVFVYNSTVYVGVHSVSDSYYGPISFGVANLDTNEVKVIFYVDNAFTYQGNMCTFTLDHNTGYLLVLTTFQVLVDFTEYFINLETYEVTTHVITWPADKYTPWMCFASLFKQNRTKVSEVVLYPFCFHLNYEDRMIWLPKRRTPSSRARGSINIFIKIKDKRLCALETTHSCSTTTTCFTSTPSLSKD